MLYSTSHNPILQNTWFGPTLLLSQPKLISSCWSLPQIVIFGGSDLGFLHSVAIVLYCQIKLKLISVFKISFLFLDISKHYSQKATLEQDVPTATQKLITTNDCILSSVAALTNGAGKVTDFFVSIKCPTLCRLRKIPTT